MTEIITSLQNSTIKKILSLRLKKNRAENRLFVAHGVRTVSAGLDGVIYRPDILLFCHQEIHHPEMQRLRRQGAQQKINIMLATKKVMEKISGRDNPQPVIGVFHERVADFTDLSGETPHLIVALDRVRDPGNLGTILRTMDAVGAGTLFLIGDCCDSFSPEVLRAAMGSLFRTRIARGSEDDFIAMMRGFSGQIIGTAAHDNAMDYRQISYQQPCVLMMGNEQMGLSPRLLDKCTHLAKLPMRDGVESLNLSVATAVMLYRIFAP